MKLLELSRLIAAEAVRDFDENPTEENRREARAAGRAYYEMRRNAEIAAYGGPEAHAREMRAREQHRLEWALHEAHERLRAVREGRYAQSTCAPRRPHADVLADAEARVAEAARRLRQMVAS